jgi:DNA polymerase-3 subunit gamma/tau
MEPGRIDLRLTDRAPPKLPQQLSRLLSNATGDTWLVSPSNEVGEPTLQEQQETQAAQRRGEAERHPLVRAALEHFPGAEIREVRDLVQPIAGQADETAGDTLDEDDIATEHDS